MESNCLTTGEVARLCRVSEATVKRWQDAGILQSERTSGGHRRFRAEEIARFRREQRIKIDVRGGGDSSVKALTRRSDSKHLSGCDLFHALIAGGEEEAANQLIGAHLRGKLPAEIFDEMICPAMRRIGELWCAGELTIAQEHMAPRAASNAVHRLRAALPVAEANNNLAICCAAEGDFHELPTLLAQTIFESEGWEVLNFGANTPLYCLETEIERHSPQMICVVATIIPDIERFARDYKIFTGQIADSQIPIILGGRAFNDEQIRRRFPADFYARNFAEVVALTENMPNENQQ